MSGTAPGATGPVNEQDKTLAICNETDFDRHLRRVPKRNFDQEKGHEYMSLYATARTTLLDEVLEDIRGSYPSNLDHSVGPVTWFPPPSFSDQYADTATWLQQRGEAVGE